jgi:hypothetical protein
MRVMKNAYKVLVKNLEGKRPLRRPSCRWEDNIRIGLMEVGWKVVDWVHLAHCRYQEWVLENTVVNLKVL